jgi:hypothetical protein
MRAYAIVLAPSFLALCLAVRGGDTSRQQQAILSVTARAPFW